MKYGENEQYVRHVDYYNREERFFGHDLEKFGGQRIKTALLYLTTAEKGGETVFHNAAKNNSVGLNSCAKKCAFALRVRNDVRTCKGFQAELMQTRPKLQFRLVCPTASCILIAGQPLALACSCPHLPQIPPAEQ